MFSAETLVEAMDGVIEDMAEKTVEEVETEILEMSALLAAILAAPIGGYFAEISAGTLTTAAALAPVLYLVRLALYHWNRMAGEEDSLLTVFGDWLAAGFLAISAGPFLDAIVQTGWWMANAAIGETNELAVQFMAATRVTNELSGFLEVKAVKIIGGIILILGHFGKLIGILGLAFAIASAQAVLYVLAVIAPVVAVLAVVPHMKWLKIIWLKAVAVLALVPVAAGGVFKAWSSLTAYVDGDGWAAMLIRLFWLWGAVGFLLSLAGILGKLTLSSAVDTTARIGKALKSIQRKSGGSDRDIPASKGDGKTPSKVQSQASRSMEFLFEASLEAPRYLQSSQVGDVTGPSPSFSSPQTGSGGATQNAGFETQAPNYVPKAVDSSEPGEQNPQEINAYAREAARYPGESGTGPGIAGGAS